MDERDLVGGRRGERRGWPGRLRAFVVGAGIALVGTALTAAPTLAAVPTGNLLVNPEAEAPPSLDAEGDYTPPQGWTWINPETEVQGPYDSCYGGGVGNERDVVDSDERSAVDFEYVNSSAGRVSRAWRARNAASVHISPSTFAENGS